MKLRGSLCLMGVIAFTAFKSMAECRLIQEVVVLIPIVTMEEA